MTRAHVIVAQCKTIPAMYEPITGEAMAALHGAELCRDLGLFDVILEGDSLMVVQAVAASEPSWQRYEQIVDDNKLVMGTLRMWKISYV